MKKLHIRSLFKKLFVSFVLVALVTVFSLGVFLPNQLSSYLTENARSRLEEEARLIIPSISIFFSGRISFDAMQQILTTIEYFSSAQVFLTDRDGQILVTSAGYAPNVRGQFIGNDELSGLLENNQFSLQGYNLRLATYALTLAFPIHQQTADQMSVVGTLYLETPLDVIGASSAIVQKQALVIVFISFVLALILAYFFSRHIAEPLNALTVAAQSMARGNYAITIPYDEDDEIGDLIESFNNLSRSLQKSIDSLLAEKGRMENLLRSLTEGVIATENNETVVLFNPAAQQLLAIPIDENPNGKKLAALHFPEELYQMMSEDSSNIVTKILPFPNERFVAATVSPVLDRLGRFTGHVTVLQDITEAHTLELQRKAFVANVSHELRTPLTVMIVEADYFLSRKHNPEEYINHVSGLVNDLKKLNELLNSLLELAQINRENNIQLSEVRIDEIVFTSIQHMKIKYPDRKIITKIAYPENGNELLISGNPGLLDIAFKNLLDNACKFSNDDVIIELLIIGEFIKIIIMDSGIGIPSNELNNIYIPFKRASNVKFKSGFGIGLSLVAKIFTLHDAALKVFSIENRETRFEILFNRVKLNENHY